MTDDLNPYVCVIAGTGEQWPDLTEAWNDLWALLAEGTHTREELMAATGIKPRTVKGLIYHGRRAGKLQALDVRREVEVSPGVWVLRTVRGFRATLTCRVQP